MEFLNVSERVFKWNTSFSNENVYSDLNVSNCKFTTTALNLYLGGENGISCSGSDNSDTIISYDNNDFFDYTTRYASGMF